MKESLWNQINDALKARGSWERKQQTWYAMRHGGIRRVSKPYVGAPDGHYPLGDTMIEKLKPLYIQQLYSNETIASFVSLRQQDEDMTSSAAYWYDYQLKQKSNFERAISTAVDEMLQDGFTPVKVYWDTDCKKLAFDQVDPLHLIVPEGTQEYNSGGGADWLVHVLHLSEAEYRANENFKQDDEFIKSIKGKGSKEESGSDAKKQEVEVKEGINCSANSNEIVLWEIYNRDRKAKKITIETISPILGHEDEHAVRAPFSLPYHKGIFKGGQTFPFCKLRTEIKSKGHYSSRGIIEINAPFEGALTKSWNILHEWMDFSSRPMFENNGTNPIPNAANFKTGPGKIMPPGLRLATPPPAPTSLRQDMEMTRAIAEDRTQIPDLGASQHLSGGRNDGGRPTATQINAIVGQSNQGNDMRARGFRLDLAELLKMGWAIELQYGVTATITDDAGNVKPDPTSFTYIVDSEIRTLDQNAIHEDYEISPNGSADSWNKGARVQKHMAYFQQLQGNPFIDQGELTKMLLEAEDPRWVKRLYRDPGVQQQTQMEEQASEIGLMLLGFPAQVSPTDDDKTHMFCIKGFVERRLIAQELITPEFARLILQHGAGHAEGLMQKKDPIAQAINQEMMPLIQLLGQIAQSDQAPNVIQMQQPGGAPQGVTLDSPLSPQGPPDAATLSQPAQPVAAPLTQ